MTLCFQHYWLILLFTILSGVFFHQLEFGVPRVGREVLWNQRACQHAAGWSSTPTAAWATPKFRALRLGGTVVAPAESDVTFWPSLEALAGPAGLRMSVRWLHQARTFHAFLIAWHQRSILGQGGRCMSNITWVLWPVWKKCAEYSRGNARPDLNGKICEPCDLLGLADSFQSSKNSAWRFGFPHLYAQRISEPCCTGVFSS